MDEAEAGKLMEEIDEARLSPEERALAVTSLLSTACQEDVKTLLYGFDGYDLFCFSIHFFGYYARAIQNEALIDIAKQLNQQLYQAHYMGDWSDIPPDRRDRNAIWLFRIKEVARGLQSIEENGDEESSSASAAGGGEEDSQLPDELPNSDGVQAS